MTVVEYAPTQTNGRPFWIDVMDRSLELAEIIANTDFVPKALRGNTAAIMACVMAGHELGMAPMQSLMKIAVIDGRPTLSAEAQRALVLASGGELWFEESTATRCVCAGRRRGDKTTTRVVFTMDDAKRAGLAGKKNWQTYPRPMLQARASAELCRMVFPDVIGGLAATEELTDDAVPTDAGELQATTEEKPKTTRRRRAATTSETAAADVDALREIAADPVTPGELRAIMADFRELGMADDDKREARLSFASEAIGRPLASSKDLTTVEAKVLLEALRTAREKAVEDALKTELDATEVTGESGRSYSERIPPAVQEELEMHGPQPDPDDDFPPGY
jgi:hypothetical protein